MRKILHANQFIMIALLMAIYLYKIVLAKVNCVIANPRRPCTCTNTAVIRGIRSYLYLSFIAEAI